MSDTESGAGELGWRQRHPSLATLVAAALALLLITLVLLGHLVATRAATESAHEIGGDFVYFGMLAVLVALAAGVVIARLQRR